MKEFTIDSIYERLFQAQVILQEDLDSRCTQYAMSSKCNVCKHCAPCELINQAMIAVEEMKEDK